MYSSRREKFINERNRCSREVAFTSFKIILCFSIFISCTTPPKKKSELEDVPRIGNFESNLNRTCFSGIGRGRINILNQNYVFDFESLMNANDRVWSLALQAPVFGEELFHLNWGRADKGKVRPFGPFYLRINYELRARKKEGEFYKKMLQKMLLRFSVFFQMLNDFRNSKNKYVCKALKAQGQFDQGVCYLSNNKRLKFMWRSASTLSEYIFPIDKRYSVSIKTSRPDDDLLTFNEFVLNDARHPERRPLYIALTNKSCERKP